ncbi:MAG: hypothetical protein K8T91_28360 [Planctomycetes bacterium]|nr:hypothetical protein [Planctomycetota bacterium]
MTIRRKALNIALAVSGILLVSAGAVAVAQDVPSSSSEAWEPLTDSSTPPPEPVPWIPGSTAPAQAPPSFGNAAPPSFSSTSPRPSSTPSPLDSLAPRLPPPVQWQPIEEAHFPAAYPVSPAPLPLHETPWPVSSTWYLRADYFHWNERIDGFDLLNEDGVLTTLGYERRIDRQRFLVELFGGDVHYDGAAMFDDGSIEPLSSHTEYLGARAEYDVRFALDYSPGTFFVAGLGTRFWLRNLPNAMTAGGDPVYGYQETWWTIYPYLGLEWKRPLGPGAEVYGSARLGVTAITYQFATVNDATLYPAPGLTTQLEYGIRGSDLFLAGYLEVMSWGESPVSHGWLQPESTMLTAGIKAGWMY